MKLTELIVVIAAALVPIFILANEVSGDEFVKAAAGVLMGGTVAAVVAIYKVWKGGEG
jgi:hypothetical protein